MALPVLLSERLLLLEVKSSRLRVECRLSDQPQERGNSEVIDNLLSRVELAIKEAETFLRNGKEKE